MGSRIALALRLLAALAVGTTVLVVAEPATALTVPKTLADRRPVQAGPVESEFPIDSVGVIWDVDHGHGHAEEAHGAEEHGAVRFRADGTWGPWIPLVEDGAAAEGQWASALVDGGDADAYQVRGIPADAGSPRAVAINTTDGPAVKVGERPSDAAGALSSSMCRSRADWGADETLRFEADGSESWPAEHHPVQVLSVHHTATKNGETGDEAEARLRSIYRYHAIDRGWGDIGYQYLIDAAGVVYEGRYSGSYSTSCELSGGDGSDFGHETDVDGDLDGDGVADEMVTGAHIGGYNTGNLGVSLLGTFTKRYVDPTAAAVDSLETVLAELSARHGLEPEGKVDYVNPVNGYEKTIDTISAHRDWASTECPGDRLYAKLPDIRKAVTAEMGTTTDPDLSPTVAITSPAGGATVSGTTTVTADASDDHGVRSVELTAAGTSIGTATVDTTTNVWSLSWDTTESPEGLLALAAVATDTTGQQTTHSISVTVDNVAESSALAVDSIDPGTLVVGSNPVTIKGAGFVAGAVVSFANGRGSTPTAGPVSFVDGSTLSATVTVEGKGPSGRWDVVVTLSTGESAVCSGCAYVQR